MKASSALAVAAHQDAHGLVDHGPYDIAVSALNDRFTEMDRDHPVPYSAPPTA